MGARCRRIPLSRGGASCRGASGRRRRATAGAAGLALAFALVPTACGGVLARAEAQFDAGQYPTAKQIFASVEAEAARWPLARRAEYALYRGLTFDALGDEAQAAVWLRRAAAIELSHPGALSPIDVRRLDLVASVLSDRPVDPILPQGGGGGGAEPPR